MDTSGPLFDGSADRIVAGMSNDIERSVGQTGEEMVRARLGEVLQNPTGYYESHIRSEPDGSDVQINDSGVVYGSWLEGTGSRNRSTRFKGYATFRRVAQELERQSGRIAGHVAEPWIKELG